MQQQQDKEFDARLREKMEDFKVSPPASLWEKIDEEVNGPVRKAKPGFGWLKIAASVCLLAAAGMWLYRQQSPFKKDIVSIVGEQDTVTGSPEPKVTIFNKSRSRQEAGQGQGPVKSGEKDAGQGSGDRQPQGAEKASGVEKAPKSQVATSEKTLASRGNTSRVSDPSQTSPSSQSKADQPGNRAQGESPGRAGDPVIAFSELKERRDPLSERDDPRLARAASPGTERVAVDTEELAAAAGELTAGELTADAEELAVNAAELGAPGQITPDRGEAAADGIGADANMHRNEREQIAAGLTEKKNTIVPKEIRELSGVGEALNMVASTIDRSEDKFIRIGKDEDSGKWNGVRLDLGLVTISYNRPEKKTHSNKN